MAATQVLDERDPAPPAPALRALELGPGGEPKAGGTPQVGLPPTKEAGAGPAESQQECFHGEGMKGERDLKAGALVQDEIFLCVVAHRGITSGSVGSLLKTVAHTCT